MSEFSDMLERVKLNSIIGYLMYGTEDAVIEDKGTYEERIENAYDKIFETLEKMFPSANKKNDELIGAVMDFSITHNEVYLEMGIIVGIQMYKNLEQQQYLDLTNIQKIIKDTVSADMKREKAYERK
ncbi:hypothetical protein [Enterocloster bolteae]|uniref:hypothetical protein n=1 Tax=Enterocloster bolteae TaxID=208479 RepID=UPI00210EDB62|nr:hypothetical protein [Enterocloster bolteae]MCQ5143653.1 hypothetical protein [Enterocloster bolteae]